MPQIKAIHYKRLVYIFENDNFIYRRAKGDHIVYTKAGLPHPLVIPMYKEVPVFVIKNLIHTAGISRERYFELLDKC